MFGTFDCLLFDDRVVSAGAQLSWLLPIVQGLHAVFSESRQFLQACDTVYTYT
jgi:hypothetical protein